MPCSVLFHDCVCVCVCSPHPTPPRSSALPTRSLSWQSPGGTVLARALLPTAVGPPRGSPACGGVLGETRAIFLPPPPRAAAGEPVPGPSLEAPVRGWLWEERWNLVLAAGAEGS